jgi:hypothetical protein
MPDFGFMYYLPVGALEKENIHASLERSVRDHAFNLGWHFGDFDFTVQSDMAALVDTQCPDGHRRVDLILRGVKRRD